MSAGDRCSNCSNGNHTGTNGSPGCTGGSCACSCRDALADVVTMLVTIDTREATTHADGVADAEAAVRSALAAAGLAVTTSPALGDLLLAPTALHVLEGDDVREGDPEPFAPRHVYGLEVERDVARFGPRSTLAVDGTSSAGNVIVRVGHELLLDRDGATGWTQTEHVVLAPAEARSLAVVLAELVESDTLADVEAGA